MEMKLVVIGGTQVVAIEYEPDFVAILPTDFVSAMLLLEQSWINVGPDHAPVFKTVRDIVLESMVGGTMQ